MLCASTGRADVISDWNIQTAQSVGGSTPPRRGPSSVLDFRVASTTAIREGENDGNPRTAGDPTWTSLFNAPNYPDYTSGANNVAGTTTTVLQHLFGDQVAFTLISAAAGSIPRDYTRFSDVGRDVVDARIFMGIHFRFADTTALRQGSLVAGWTFSHCLRPIGGGKD